MPRLEIDPITGKKIERIGNKKVNLENQIKTSNKNSSVFEQKTVQHSIFDKNLLISVVTFILGMIFTALLNKQNGGIVGLFSIMISNAFLVLNKKLVKSPMLLVSIIMCMIFIFMAILVVFYHPSR